MFWKSKDPIRPIVAELHELRQRVSALETFKSVQLGHRAEEMAKTSGLFEAVSAEETNPGRRNHRAASAITELGSDVCGDDVVEESFLTKHPVKHVLGLGYADGIVTVRYAKDD